jgi:hypothetical protein
MGTETHARQSGIPRRPLRNSTRLVETSGSARAVVRRIGQWPQAARQFPARRLTPTALPLVVPPRQLSPSKYASLVAFRLNPPRTVPAPSFGPPPAMGSYSCTTACWLRSSRLKKGAALKVGWRSEPGVHAADCMCAIVSLSPQSITAARSGDPCGCPEERIE